MSYPESAYGGRSEGESSPVAEYDAPSSEGTFSVIDRYSKFDGTFTADRDLRIDGEVKGTIECRGTLLVAEGAAVEATVDAENIAIAGQLNGEIRCVGRLQLLPTGRLSGTVATSSLVISEGAMYEGDLTMDESPRNSANGGVPTLSSASSRDEASVTAEANAGENPPATTSEPPQAETVPTTFIRRLGGSETPWNADQSDETTEEKSDAEQAE